MVTFMSTYYVPGTILSALSIISFNGIIEEKQRLTQGKVKGQGRNTGVGDEELGWHGGREREREGLRDGGRERWRNTVDTWNGDKREGRVTCDCHHRLDSIIPPLRQKPGTQKLCLRELPTDKAKKGKQECPLSQRRPVPWMP